MYIVADACTRGLIVDRLREDGHEVFSIAEEQEKIRKEKQAERIEPFEDEKILEKATQKQYVTLSEDRDFGEMIFKDRRAAPSGVIYYKLDGLSEEKKAERMSEACKKYDNQLENKFLVVEHATERIRDLNLEQSRSR